MRSAVVIPTYNGRARLEEALGSLERQSVPPTEVVVVDNGSTDGTAERVATAFPAVRVLRQERNLGFGAAINVGAAAVGADVLVLVNNDVVCEQDFVERMLEPFADPGVGMVAGVLLQAARPARIDSAGLELDRTLRSWDYLGNEPAARLAGDPSAPIGPCGGAAAYRLGAFRAAGGFDEGLFAYWEDVDLALRLRAAGWRCALAPDARALHRHGATVGAASPRMRELDAFGRGYLLGKYRVGWNPLTRLAILALDWPALLVHLVVRREAAPIRARRRGVRAGRGVAAPAVPRGLVTVGVGDALGRQYAFLLARLRGRLPEHYTTSD